jgi:hypothetical protein
MKRLKTGKNWRVGWDETDTNSFQGLLGGEDWACELTAAEFDDFVRLLTELGQSMESMTADLMDEEAIAINQSTDLLWMQINGYPRSYSLSFILLTGRRAEGQWDELNTLELIQAIQTIKLL